MSLMLRLLATIAIISSLSFADDSSEKVESFLEDSFMTNPKIKSIDVNVTDVMDVQGHKDWKAYYVKVDAVLKKDSRKVVQKMVWFSNGKVIAKDIYDLESTKEMKELVSLPFKKEYYHKANLIYGNENAKYKAAIFSDPLCPFCKEFVPQALEYMKKEPNKYAVYYYHFPLQSLHPAAVALVKAAIALELKGRKDVILNLYKIKINPKEKSNEKILAEFNKVMNSDIKMQELLSKEVLDHLKNDQEVADMLMVNSTPTMFFDGKIDKTKNRYKEAK